MAVIDSKKLLPPSKSSSAITEAQKPFLVPVSNIVYKKDINISQKLLKSSDKVNESGGKLTVIRKKVLQIKDVINNTYLIEQSENNRKRKERERQKAEDRERTLETKKPNQINEKNLAKVSIPGGNIFDTIKRFLAFTFLGFLVNNYIKYLPKLIEFGKYIEPVTKFIDAFSKNVVDGVINFIDLGYRAYDKVNKMIGDVGGKDASKQFEKFSTEFNKLLNGAIMASMLIASTSPKGISGATGAGASGALSGITPKPTGGFGAGTGMTPGRYRAPGQARAGGFALEQARKNATQTSLTQASKAGAKGAARLGIARVPIIGALISFIIDTVVFKEKPSRAAAGAVGNAVGSGIGLALAGAGTFGLGAGVGLFVGGFLGDIVGKSLYDAFVGAQPEPTQAKAQGGQVTGGQSRMTPTRKIQTRRTPVRKTYIPSKTVPGKDIGGKQKIEQLYGSDTPGQRSPLRALKKSSEDLKKMKSMHGIAGGMLGAGIDMSLGQKPDKKLANSLGSMFGSVVEAAVNAELNSSFNDISKSIAMANGGVVPSREIGAGMSIGEKIGKYISSAFSIALESSAARVLGNLNQELNLEGGAVGAPPGGSGAGAGGYATGSENFVSSKEIYSYLKSKGLSHNHAMGILANIQAESSFNAGAIGDGGTSGGLFQHHDTRFTGMVAFAGKDWAKNWKRQVDYALREAAGKQYAQKTFNSPEEASEWFTLYFEIPEFKEQKAKQRLGNLKNFGSDGSWIGSTGGPSLSTKGVKKFSRADITSFFRQQESFRAKPHEGMDIASPQGTPISFGMGGEVLGVWRTNSGSRDANGGYGTYMDVKFSDGRIARIAHLSNVPSSLSKGSKFRANQVIAYSGGEEGKPGSGRSGGPHIHLEQLSKPMGIEETTKGKSDPLKGGLFDLIQKGGVKLSLAPTQQSREIASLQQGTPYTVVHDVNNIVMPVMVG